MIQRAPRLIGHDTGQIDRLIVIALRNATLRHSWLTERRPTSSTRSRLKRPTNIRHSERGDCRPVSYWRTPQVAAYWRHPNEIALDAFVEAVGSAQNRVGSSVPWKNRQESKAVSRAILRWTRKEMRCGRRGISLNCQSRRHQSCAAARRRSWRCSTSR